MGKETKMNINFKSAIKAAGRHGKILIKGFTRMLYGALTAGLIGLAVYGFIMVPSEGGYLAVFDFIGAIATICVAVACIYHQGGGKRKRGGYER